MVSQLGFTVWFPATGLVLAVMLASVLGTSANLIASALAGAVIYHQPVLLERDGCSSARIRKLAIAASLLRGH